MNTPRQETRRAASPEYPGFRFTPEQEKEALASSPTQNGQNGSSTDEQEQQLTQRQIRKLFCQQLAHVIELFEHLDQFATRMERVDHQLPPKRQFFGNSDPFSYMPFGLCELSLHDAWINAISGIKRTGELIEFWPVETHWIYSRTRRDEPLHFDLAEMLKAEIHFHQSMTEALTRSRVRKKGEEQLASEVATLLEQTQLRKEHVEQQLADLLDPPF